MDTSKEYILMCEKAEEIQEKWDWVSDFCCLYDKISKKCFCNIHLYCYDSSIDKKKPNKEIFIWLPRQDQLQEMILDTYNFYALPTYFKLFCGNEEMYEGLYAKKGLGLANEFTSLEQFWLAFIMWEKFKKIWNGKDWKQNEKI